MLFLVGLRLDFIAISEVAFLCCFSCVLGMSGLTPVRMSDSELSNTVNALVERMRSISEQTDAAERLLGSLGWGSSFDWEGDDDDDDDDDSVHIDDDESDIETVVYRTGEESVYYFDEDDDDSETVVGDWEDPLITPPQKVYNISIPYDLEYGLDFLE